MKKCKHCQTEIDSNAKICPNCRKKQGMPIWLIIILVIIGISLLGSLFGGSNDGEKQTGTTSTKETLSLEDHTGAVEDSYTYEISGTVKNNSSSDYTYVEIEFYTYDSDGNLLDTCLDNNSGIEANGTWKFNASCFFSDGNAKKVSSYKLKEITHW